MTSSKGMTLRTPASVMSAAPSAVIAPKPLQTMDKHLQLACYLRQTQPKEK
ncbi:hypothetical protein D3C81_2050700 [compost metagenome]